jgi:CheY-like chemotaxis protein
MHILLVEDDEIVRAVLTEALADAGMQVRSVAGPSAALDLPAGESPPMVLVTDVNLGVAMDGFALADAARQRWPEICIVVMSGIPENLNGDRLHPFDRFLPKPFCGSELLDVIRDLTSA